jgi:hypothetical protein
MRKQATAVVNSLAVALAVLVGLMALPAAGAPSAAFEEAVLALTKAPHRLTGTPENAAAFAYVAERIAQTQPDKVITQEFPAVQMKVARCELLIGEEVLPLEPMRPNGIILPVTPPEGLSGPLVHLGNGTLAEYSGKHLEGAIVVLDYNSGDQWLRAFRLGALAVIFTENSEAESWQSHIVDTHVNLPRFYLEGSPDQLPEGAVVTVHSEVTWESVTGRNLFAFYEGTDPTFSQGREEVVTLSAQLDTFGEVPFRSPGARAAANVAGLIKLSEAIAQERPRRHMLVAFFDAQSQAHKGAARFFKALETRRPYASVESRTASLDGEWNFIQTMLEHFEYAEPLAHRSKARRQLINRLRDRAAEMAYEVADEMYLLRTERSLIKQAASESGEAPDAERLAEIEAFIKDTLQPEKDDWNDIRRLLGEDRTEDATGELKEKLDLILADVRTDVELRRDEMVLERRALDADRALLELLGDKWITLHTELKLGDSTPRWGLIIGGDSEFHSIDDIPGLYGKVQASFLRAARALEGTELELSNFETATADQSLPHTRVLWAAPYLVHGGEIAGMFGIYNLCFATCQESLSREGTPVDFPSRLNTARIEAKIDEISRMLLATSVERAGEEPLEAQPVASQPGLSLRRGVVANKDYALPTFSNETVSGPTVMGLLPGSSIPNKRMAGAIVQMTINEPTRLSYNNRKPYAFQNFIVERTTQNGTYEVGPLREGWPWGFATSFAAVFDERGEVSYISDADSSRTGRERLNVFPAQAGWMVLPPQLQVFRTAEAMILLSARDNGALQPKKSYLQVNDGVATWFADPRQEGVKLFELGLTVALNSGPATSDDEEEVNPLGVGYEMGPSWTPKALGRRSALDLWRLNDSRIQMLQDKNIIDSSLAELHGRAEDLLLETIDEPVTINNEATEVASFMSSRPVYNKTRGMVDDLVFAVLLLLGLSVPFAFAIERLIIGATTIYKQMGWFGGLFVLTFLLLFFTHPAFAIANTPVIIFLGFAILILSLLVISIIMQRFETELKVLQGMPATVHAADVSRMGALMAAMQMGISTMRRRPFRTALTAITIVLLTFTILSFASFGTQSGVVRLFSAPVPSYSGVFVHRVNWGEFNSDIMDVIHGRWGEEAEVFERRWISPGSDLDPGLLLTTDEGTAPLSIPAVLGIDPAEIVLRRDLQALLGEDLEGKILLTPAVARAVGVTEGDVVIFSGISLTVGRLTDPVALSTATDMDGESILPVDFTEAGATAGGAAATVDGMETPMNWTSLPADEVVILSKSVAARLGAGVRAWTVYTEDFSQSAAIADNMARMLPIPVAATLPDGVHRHILGTVVAASGVSDLIFPVLLGGLVIFGTMLGSVADREKEIYTFSALGLAPRHVATLFVAESLVYSLIGGMGGYLLAQSIMRVLNTLAEYGLVSVPEMNMSSTNTIVTILIVMATVMVSAIYPAIKASRSANPGLMRSWSPPEPQGNVMDMVFPFTVSEYDITGVVSFLREHFENHSDVGLGQFMARDTVIVREEDGLGVRSDVALAPFDLGVSQKFHFRSTPSEIPGIDEVRICLTRTSGQPKDWQRLNRVLLDDLRQQFLIWRALPEETMEIYRHRTLAELGETEASTASGGAHT